MNKHVVRGHVLPDDLERRLQRVAGRTQKSPTRLLELALNYFLDQVETDDEVHAVVEESVREYDETGLHLTNEDVREWAARVADGEDAPPPEPHT